MTARFSPDLIAGFPAATGQDVDATALQRRFDRKFVLTEAQFHEAIAAARGNYKLLWAGGERLALYRTTYFDTPCLDLYRQHARGQRPRYKIRIRHYPDRNVSFAEVKLKTNKDQTIKHRLAIPFGQELLLATQRDFVRGICPIDPSLLRPVLCTHFERLTLLSPALLERVTTDFHLTYEAQGRRRVIERLVITEVKQGAASSQSPFVQALRRASLRPQSFSKYSMGVALAGLAERINPFLPTLKMIERLAHA